jgi:hypothetical protein
MRLMAQHMTALNPNVSFSLDNAVVALQNSP